jgi:hypothetical protein
MKEMPAVSTDSPVTYDDAVRAAELLYSYFRLPGLLFKSVEADSIVTRMGLRDLLTTQFGSPESELRRKTQAVIGKIRIKSSSSHAQKREFAKLHSTLKRFAEGK